MKNFSIEKLKNVSLTALLIASAMFTACSSSDEILNEQPADPTEQQVYTMTIKASKGDAATRGLSLSGKTLSVKWNEGEKVDVVQMDPTTYEKVLRGTLTAAASDNGSTTLTGTVSGVVETEALGLYLHGYEQSYTGQTGVLLKPASGTDNSIETNYDYAGVGISVGNFSISGSTVTVPGGVAFTSNQAIIKFSFVDALNNQPLIVKSLGISGTYNGSIQNVELSYNWLDGMSSRGTLTVEPTTPASSFYVALKSGFSDTYSQLTLNAVGQDGLNYIYEKSSVTLVSGKYYEITVKMSLNIEAVDLGLPSGTKWAPMNVGAASETDSGSYFAWAGTTGYAYESGHDFSNDNCPYVNSNSDPRFSKYNGTDYQVLQAVDDAATANWGSQWRMPTMTEWNELKENCTAEWKQNYKGSGINGILFTSTKTGYTDKSIFLPANGFYIGTNNNGSSIDLDYWSSEYNGLYGKNLEAVYDGNNQFTWGHYMNMERERGLGVRAVTN